MNLLEVLKEQKKMKLKGNIYHVTQIKFSYNSNHIEGSTLTEDETRIIFETNTINKTNTKVDDIVETTNHFFLFDEMLENCNNELTEKLIKYFHKILKRGTNDERTDWFNVGEYKGLPNVVGGKDTTHPDNVKEEMEKLLNKYNKIKEKKLEDVIKFHYHFEKIHPFQDGNGRVGRIIMFMECLKNNIIPLIVLDKYKEFYYRGLKEFETEPNYLIDSLLSMQDKYQELVNKFLN